MAVNRIKGHTDLPVAVGFGIKTAEQASEIGRESDGVVVGSVLVNAIRDSLNDAGMATEKTVPAVTGLVSDLARGVANARSA
jgi:tryptophan synthase alpha chain